MHELPAAEGREVKRRTCALPHSFHSRTKHRNRPHKTIELTDTVQNNTLFVLTCRRAGACTQGTWSRLQQSTSSVWRATFEAPLHHFQSLTAVHTSSLVLSQVSRRVPVSLVTAATVVYLSLLPFHPQPFLLPSTTSRQLLHHPPPTSHLHYPTHILPFPTPSLFFTSLTYHHHHHHLTLRHPRVRRLSTTSTPVVRAWSPAGAFN